MSALQIAETLAGVFTIVAFALWALWSTCEIVRRHG